MIPIYHWPSAEAKKYLKKVSLRGSKEDTVLESRVATILNSVKKMGDPAVRKWIRQFEEYDPKELKIDPMEIKDLASQADPELLKIIKQAKKNIWDFHQRQRENSWEFEAKDGVKLGQRITPLQTVGLYVPGGTAAYPSTVLMNAIPAQIAGVPRIVVSTPYQNFKKNPLIAAVFKELRLEEVYGVGGAQAIAALAYGTATIPKVNKIVGPGNAFVAEAKKQVFGSVDIDVIAGPSEVVIVSDEFANPVFVAADLMAQAEHDESALAIAITFSVTQAEAIKKSLVDQVKNLSRKTTIHKSLNEFGGILVVKQIKEAAEIVNNIAPEHLELLMEGAESFAEKIDAAGAIFFGETSCETVGDYFAGPNHVLPTGGTSQFASPLGVYDFIKRTNLIKYSRQAITKNYRAIEKFALAEKLDAHAHSVRIRVDS